MATVKCAECGYLGMRHIETRQIIEAEEVTRKHGVITHEGEPICKVERFPLCLMRVADFRLEMSQFPAQAAFAQRENVVCKSRECDFFTTWDQGFTPKEHVEMKFLEEQRKWQDKRDLDDRNWRERQANVESTRHRQNLWGLWAATLLAAALGAVLGAVVSK